MFTQKEDTSFARLLTDSNIDAIIATDPDAQIVVWNRTAETIYGKKASEVLGLNISEALPSIKDDEEMLKAIEAAGKGFKSFVPASNSFRHRLHAEIHVIPLWTEAVRKGTMFVVHDVSHRIRAEEQLQYLNDQLQTRLTQLKNTTRELASMTHVTTHNVKEPLRNIYTAIEWLIRTEGTKFSDNGRASFRRIQSSLTRMSLLLDDIVTLTQINTVEPATEQVNTEEMVAEVTKALHEKINALRATINMSELCEIRAHRSHVYLLLLHIIGNALSYNQKGVPVITINCRKVDAGEVDEGIPPGTYHMLKIVHNGVGFDNTDIEKLSEMFDKISDKNYKGSTFALAVASKVMEAHGGYIFVDHNENEESSFKCYFPL